MHAIGTGRLQCRDGRRPDHRSVDGAAWPKITVCSRWLPQRFQQRLRSKARLPVHASRRRPRVRRHRPEPRLPQGHDDARPARSRLHARVRADAFRQYAQKMSRALAAARDSVARRARLQLAHVQVGTPRSSSTWKQLASRPSDSHPVPPRDRVGFRTVDVLGLGALRTSRVLQRQTVRVAVPPELRGPGRRPREEPSRLDEGARDDLMATKRRLDEAERASTTDKLLQLSQQCAQLHVKRLATPRYEAPPSSFSVRDQGRDKFIESRDRRLQRRFEVAHPQPVQYRVSLQSRAFAPQTMMNSSLASTGAFTANTRKRRQSKPARCATAGSRDL